MAQPSQINIVKNDTASWTVKVSHVDGISHLDSFYGKLPYTYKWRDMGGKCPNDAQFRIQKKRKFFFRSIPFHDAAVVACPSADNGKYTVTHFRISKNNSLKVGHTHERSKDDQRLLDYAEMDSVNKEWNKYLIRPILVFILLTLITILIGWWTGLGPFMN